MQQIYSPFRKPGRPNQIVDILSRIRPDLDRLNSFFHEGNYVAVIETYERLRQEYQNFETDLGKIAFAYFQLGRLENAEAYIERMLEGDRADADDLLILCKIYLRRGATENAIAICDYLIREYHLPEAALLQAEIYHEQQNPVLEMHAYFDLLKQEEALKNTMLRIKAYSELARLMRDTNPGEAEYYLYMSLQSIGQADVETIEFRSALALAGTNIQALASPRIKNLLSEYNLRFGHKIHRLYSEDFERIMDIPSMEVTLLEMTDELIGRSLSTIERFRKEIEQRGDYIVRSLNDHFEAEQPTFAYITEAQS